MFPPTLTPLPGPFDRWKLLSQDERAKIMLTIKNTDATRYQLLRKQALRCAPAA